MVKEFKGQFAESEGEDDGDGSKEAAITPALVDGPLYEAGDDDLMPNLVLVSAAATVRAALAETGTPPELANIRNKAYTISCTILGVPLEGDLDTQADVSIMPLNVYDALPSRFRPELDLKAMPQLKTFMGTSVASDARKGWAAVPLSVHASVTMPGQAVPTAVHGEQTIKFLVVQFDAPARVLIGKPALMDGSASTIGQMHSYLAQKASITYPGTPGALTNVLKYEPLGKQVMVEPARVLYDPPGDPVGEDSWPTEWTSPAEEKTYQSLSIEQILNGPDLSEVPETWDAAKRELAEYVHNNQKTLYGPFAAEPLFPLVTLEARAGPPILAGINRRIPLHKVEAANEVFEKQLASNIIERCERADIENVIPFVIVVRNGRVRPTADLTALNERVPKANVLMPDMQRFHDALQDCSIFSDMDYREHFHTFVLDGQSRRLCGFQFPDSTFGRYRSLPMGLHNSPGIAQELTSRYVVVPLREQLDTKTVEIGGSKRSAHEITVYVDNATAGTRATTRPKPDTPAEAELALRHVREVIVPFLEKSSAMGLRFKVGGCKFLKRTSTALGVIFDGLTRKLDPARVEGFAAMEVPETPNLKWTQHVRGLFTFYERFVGTMDYANRLRSYTDLLVQYNNTGTRISTLFTQEHRENFRAMRQAVLNSMSFFVLDPNKLTYLQTDAASDCGWSAFYYQYSDEGTMQLICTFAHVWTDTQQGYGVKQQECFAIVAALRRIKRLNLPTQVVVRCDHGNLRWLAKQQDPWLMRWFYELASHGDIWFQHLPGAINAADHPSRIATALPPYIGEPPKFRLILDGSDEASIKGITSARAANAAKARAAKAAKAAKAAASAGAPAEAPDAPSEGTEEEEPPAPARPGHNDLSEQPLVLMAEPLGEPRFYGQPLSASGSASYLKRIYDKQQTEFSAYELIKMETDRSFSKIDAAPYAGFIHLKGDGRLVVPAACDDIKNEILAAGHEQFFHGSKADLARRTHTFYWLDKDADMDRYLETCAICQVMRAPQRLNAAGRAHLKAPSKPLQYIIMDHVPMQTSRLGFTAILTFADTCTRYQTAIAVRNMSAAATLGALELYKTHFSLPRIIQTDNSTSFEGEFADYLKKYNIEHVKTPAYYPQANGKGERPHKTLWEKLRAACPGGEWQNWDTMLPYVMEAINTQWHRSLHMTPYEALYGEPAYSVVDADLARPQDFLPFNQSTYREMRKTLAEILATRETVRMIEQRHVLEAKQHEAPLKYSEGDNVLLYREREHKGGSAWAPGYVIKTVDPADPDFYIVSKRELTGEIVGSERVPVARLRPFNAERSPDFGVTMDIKPDHGVVESIVSHSRNAAGDYSFRVKWVGRQGEHSISTAGLQSLMRNCTDMLKAYCQAQKPTIKWSHLQTQRATHNAMLREQGIKTRQ